MAEIHMFADEVLRVSWRPAREHPLEQAGVVHRLLELTDAVVELHLGGGWCWVSIAPEEGADLEALAGQVAGALGRAALGGTVTVERIPWASFEETKHPNPPALLVDDDG